MMGSRYLSTYVVSEIRLNVFVSCICTVTAACTKDHVPGTKDYLRSLSFV